MYARKRLDIDVSTLLKAMPTALLARDEAHHRARLEGLWGGERPALATLSIRSGFDLFLASVDWAPGSEVLMSAVTIPHMERLVREHGYVPVPVEVDLDRMWPTFEAMERARTTRTRCVVIAHLFGTRGDLGPIAEWCRRHDLLLVEDCAQAFDGKTFDGDPRADLSMFSFGTIKTATSLAGGILVARDAELLGQMRARQEEHPVQSTAAYLRKLAKGLAMILVSIPVVYTLLFAALRRGGRDPDATLRSWSRGFREETLLQEIRHRPSAGLLAVMYRVQSTYDVARIVERGAAGNWLATLFAERATPLRHLGGSARPHSHWLFPVVVDDPDAVVAAARSVGFDATSGASTLIAVGEEEQAPRAHAAMERIVYLPAYAEMSNADLERLADAVDAACVDRVQERSSRQVELEGFGHSPRFTGLHQSG